MSWNVPSDGSLTAAIRSGLVRNLWIHTLPSAFEIWQFPRVPAGFDLSQLYCTDATPWQHDYVYLNQPADDRTILTLSVDGNGAFADQRTLALTPTRSPFITDTTVDRVVRQPLMNLVKGSPLPGSLNGGIYPGELLQSAQFHTRVYPTDMNISNDNRNWCFLRTADGKRRANFMW
jgi:hypothetical protein